MGPMGPPSSPPMLFERLTSSTTITIHASVQKRVTENARLEIITITLFFISTRLKRWHELFQGVHWLVWTFLKAMWNTFSVCLACFVERAIGAISLALHSVSHRLKGNFTEFSKFSKFSKNRFFFLLKNVA